VLISTIELADRRTKRMSAYWIARARLRDMKGQDKYAKLISRIEPLYPHETLCRSGRIEVIEGTQHFDRYFLHKFPSMDLALAFYNSPQYQEAAAIRRAACDGCELVIMEGEDVVKSSM
jgi:uncharacterized protein (DUF1330 family)